MSESAAVVNYAPEAGSVEIRSVAKPTIGEEDVLVEVAAVGVCGSDYINGLLRIAGLLTIPSYSDTSLRGESLTRCESSGWRKGIDRKRNCGSDRPQ